MVLVGVLTIIFIALKLFGVIHWSWWIVLLPEIIVIVLYTAVLIINIMLAKRVQKEQKRLFDKFNY